MTRIYISIFLLVSFSRAFAQDFWRPTNGPRDTYVGTLAADSSGAMYAAMGGYGSSLYKSADGGATWTLLSSPGTIGSMAIDAQAHIWTLYSTPVAKDTLKNGIWRSRDGGQTWDSVLGRSSRGRAVMVDPSGGVLFANDRALRYSTNDGASWGDVRPRKDSAAHLANQVQSLALGSDGSFYVGTLAGLYRSTDKGSTWNPLGQGTAPRKVLTVAVATGVIYAGSDSALFKSIDAGATWVRVAAVPRAPSSIVFRSGNDVLVSSADSVVYRSTNGGVDWKELVVSKASIRQLFATRQGELLAGSSTYGLFRSVNDGVTWEESEAGMHTTSIDAIVVAPDGRLYAGSGAYVFSSSDRGDSWHAARLEPNSVFVFAVYCMAVASNGFVYAGTTRSGIYRSVDNGVTWQRANTGLNNLLVWSLAPLRDGSLLAGTDAGLYRSTDHGGTWALTTASSVGVWALTQCADGTVLAGLAGGSVKYSTDGGISWSKATIGATSDIQTFALAADGAVYAGTYTTGLYRSVDTGRNWTKIFDGPSTISTVLVIGADNIYLGGYRGIRRSRDRGVTWDSTDVNSGEGRLAIPSLARDSVGYIYAATHGLGVVRSADRIAAGVDMPASLASAEMVLEQNIPNPVSTETTISVSVRSSGEVTLQVYDLLGNEVKRVFSGIIAAGEHRYRVDCRGLAPGMYYYQLRMGTRSAARTLILMP